MESEYRPQGADGAFLERLTQSLTGIALRMEPQRPWRVLRVWGDVERITGHSPEVLAGPRGVTVLWPDVDLERFEAACCLLQKPQDRVRMTTQRRNPTCGAPEVAVLAWGTFDAQGALTSIEAIAIPARGLVRTSDSTRAVVHDVANLLAAARCATELGRRGGADHTDTALEAIDRAAFLLGQLARADQGLDCPAFPIDDTITGMLPILRTILEPQMQVRDSLNASTSAVRAEPRDVARVLMNLVVNARDAILPRPGTITIRTYAKIRGVDRRVVLEVTDDGPGIADGCLGRIFNEGFSTKEHGSGMGLVIVHDIVSRIGGSVDVESGVGSGARFRVEFPTVD